MKKLLVAGFLFVYLISISLPVFAEENPLLAPVPLPPLIINEIAAFEESGFEWIEIQNISETLLDLTDFSFYEDETKHRLNAITNDLMIDPNELAIIAQDAEKFLQKYSDFSGTLIDSSWSSLREDGEEIGLADSADNFLEKFVYLAAPETSLERKDPKLLDYTDQNWIPHPSAATPGAANVAAQTQPETELPVTETTVTEIPPETPVTETITEPQTETLPVTEPQETNAAISAVENTLFINEVSFRDSEADWVEIFLASATEGSIDLNGYSLWSDGMLMDLAEGTMVSPGNYQILSLENTDGLTATTEQVFLKNPDGKILDAVCWTNGTVAERELKDMENLMDAEMWISKEPTSCIDTVSLQKNQTIGRKIPFQDTDTKDDWEIFKHDTRGVSNEQTNQSPVALITLQRGQIGAEVPLTINVSGENSYDPDGDALRFLWNFGDGTFEESPNPKSHTYSSAGNFQLILTVEDAFEAIGTAILPIQVFPKVIPQEIIVSPLPVVKVSTQTSPTLSKQKTATKQTTTKKKKAKKKSQKIPKKKSSAKKTPKKIVKRTVSRRASQKFYRNGDLSNDLKITEILPNPEGQDNEEEWLEIYNSGEKAVRLGNWILDDDEGGSKPYIIPDTILIEPESFFIFTREESNLALNNAKENVRLFDFQKKLIDEVAYDMAPSGKSYAMVSDDFEWTEDVTPGAPNPFYHLVAGEIKMVDPTLHSIVVAGAEGLKNISFDEKTLHPLMAPLVLPAGSQVQIEVKEDGGNLALRKIDSVIPPIKEERNIVPWIIGVIITISFVVNIGFLLHTFWPKLREEIIKRLR